MKIWWDKYLSKYYKTIDYKIKNNWLILAGSDGSGIGLMSCKDYEFANSCIHVIYCVNYNKCVKDEFNITPEWGAPTNGKNSFAFYINSGGLNTLDYKVLGKREEHIYETAKISKNFSCGSEDKYAKNSYCSGLIRMDGWKISKDYPIKF